MATITDASMLTSPLVAVVLLCVVWMENPDASNNVSVVLWYSSWLASMVILSTVNVADSLKVANFFLWLYWNFSAEICTDFVDVLGSIMALILAVTIMDLIAVFTLAWFPESDVMTGISLGLYTVPLRICFP